MHLAYLVYFLACEKHNCLGYCSKKVESVRVRDIIGKMRLELETRNKPKETEV